MCVLFFLYLVEEIQFVTLTDFHSGLYKYSIWRIICNIPCNGLLMLNCWNYFHENQLRSNNEYFMQLVESALFYFRLSFSCLIINLGFFPSRSSLLIIYKDTMVSLVRFSFLFFRASLKTNKITMKNIYFSRVRSVPKFNENPL